MSDLHFGAGDDDAIVLGTPALIERFQPELVMRGSTGANPKQ